ncbi:MAG TPA: hemolysin III family protein [Isosphaeraceae bacterium]|nr:hemolysin III family protein [Isosphaeraceae bacterium]
MLLFAIREPINAVSHGAGMMLALPVTWLLWKQCGARNPCGLARVCTTTNPCVTARGTCPTARHHRLKALSLLVFGISLTFCYAASTAFHAAPFHGEPSSLLQRLDHIGIYLLIAGTYTPIAWALLRGAWLSGTLATVWTITGLCVARVWYGGVLPIWVSTLVYLAMGWGSLVCYRELARGYSHRTLLPLPLGGVFYSVGAMLNLAKWPVLSPGVFAAHELFHFFVIAGSACHIVFMLNVVVPAPGPLFAAAPARSRPRGALLVRWVRARASRRLRQWMSHVPHPRWLEEILAAGETLDPITAEGPAKVV